MIGGGAGRSASAPTLPRVESGPHVGDGAFFTHGVDTISYDGAKMPTAASEKRWCYAALTTDGRRSTSTCPTTALTPPSSGDHHPRRRSPHGTLRSRPR